MHMLTIGVRCHVCMQQRHVEDVPAAGGHRRGGALTEAEMASV